MEQYNGGPLLAVLTDVKTRSAVCVLTCLVWVALLEQQCFSTARDHDHWSGRSDTQLVRQQHQP